MYGKYNVDMLQNVMDTVNAMHRRQTELEKQASGRAFGDTKNLVESMKFGFDLQIFMKVSDEEQVKQLQVLECSSKEVMRGITVLSQGRLPQEFFSDSQLPRILSEVQKMVHKKHPNYALAVEHISPLLRHEIGNFCCGSANPFINNHFPSVYSRISKTTIIVV